MADEIYDLDPIDANNTGRWPEGMLGGQINNAGRADEGILARWFFDTNGSLGSGGSSNAFTVTQLRTMGGLGDNHTIAFTANHTITGAATLNLNDFGAKSIKRFNGSDLTAGDIVSGLPVWVTYKSATDAWYMVSAAAALFANMHADFNENGSPGTPAANVARLYAGSASVLEYVRNDGVTRRLRPASAAEMEAAASDEMWVAPSLQHRHPGHPKAWGRASGAGTLVAGSYNVASVVRNSTGNYTVTLTNAMADTNYVAHPALQTSNQNRGITIDPPGSTSQFTVRVFNTASAAATDDGFSFVVYGDM
jgi:hypothetical protein